MVILFGLRISKYDPYEEDNCYWPYVNYGPNIICPEGEEAV